MQYVTPDLCDQFPEDVRVVTPTMMNNFGARESFGGRIVTVKCHEDNSLVKEQANQPGHGKVLVVDGGGSLRKALLGDMIAEKAVSNGWEGFIIYGCIRDAAIMKTLDLGVQALGTIPLKTEKRGLGDLNIVINFGGVDFRPDEYVYADSNGIVVSAKSLTE